MKRIFFLAILLLFIQSLLLLGQSKEEEFFFDVIVFRSENPDSGRIDIFVAVPNRLLTFSRNNNIFVANFDLSIVFRDTIENHTKSYNITRQVTARDFNQTLGANAEFTTVKHSINLPPGNFDVIATITDNNTSKFYEKKRRISVINFASFDFVASALMLVSSIEEIDDTYTITPSITDNVEHLNDGYFVFFELYNERDMPSINIITEIIDSESQNIVYSNLSNQILTFGTNQCFITIPSDIKYGLKENRLCLYFARDVSELTDRTSEAPIELLRKNIIAGAQRSIRSVSSVFDKVAKNIDHSIRQLRYVATEKEIKAISSGITEADKFHNFMQFWQRLDPTPNTRRNEAMEEYYKRIEFANNNFKGFREGWLTDKGNVFVVFGPPDEVGQTNRSFSDRRTYEKWTYRRNRLEFIFVDVSGFGDFRLHSPSVVVDKFHYE